ncbi:MAG: iron-sulfur cluster repair di-iron protein [Bacteroidia bacterium]|nr:iron-sulfur cluster repair di-iron protein [Bacteroidia bacterium]
MSQYGESTLKELVSNDYRKAEVFRKYGLDFCCGGKKQLQKACSDKGISLDQVEKELSVAEQQPVVPSQDYNQWGLDFLADYIVNTHHKYVVRTIPTLYEYTQKVSKVHGGEHPEVKEIADDFLKAVDELNRHMMKEEHILFPYIKVLVEAEKAGTQVSPPGFGTIANPIRMMEMEHELVGDVMDHIEKLSSGFNPPPDACNTYRVSFAKLKEFTDDLHQHIHLENNILFPKAIELEKKLLNP